MVDFEVLGAADAQAARDAKIAAELACQATHRAVESLAAKGQHTGPAAMARPASITTCGTHAMAPVAVGVVDVVAALGCHAMAALFTDTAYCNHAVAAACGGAVAARDNH